MIHLDDDEDLELSLDNLIPGTGKEKTVKKLFVLTEELVDWLDVKASQGMNKSYVVREALKEYREKHEEG